MPRLSNLMLADHPGRQLLLVAGCARLVLGSQAVAVNMMALAGASVWASLCAPSEMRCSQEAVAVPVLPAEPVVARAPRSRSVKKLAAGTVGSNSGTSRPNSASTRRRKPEV